MLEMSLTSATDLKEELCMMNFNQYRLFGWSLLNIYYEYFKIPFEEGRNTFLGDLLDIGIDLVYIIINIFL
jgi:hypothetical protein